MEKMVGWSFNAETQSGRGRAPRGPHGRAGSMSPPHGRRNDLRTSEYQMALFADVLSIVNGKNQKAVEAQDGRYPIYGSGGVMGRANDYLCEADTVIIGRKGSINNPIYVGEPFWNVDTAFGLVANRAKLLPKYLYYFCVSFDFTKLNTTVTIPSLTKANLLKVKLPHPPLPAQRQIAAALDKISEMKRNAEARLQKLDLLVKARFNEMFGDPITNSKNLPETVFENVVRLQRGFDLPVQNRDEKGCVPIYGSNGILGFHSEARACDGVVTGRSGTIGNVYCAKGEYWPLNTSLFSVETHGNDVVYLAWLLRLFKLERFSAGTGVPTLNRNDVHRQKIIEVGVAEQRSFAAFVEKVEALKAAAQASLARVDLLYRAKLQEYFG